MGLNQLNINADSSSGRTLYSTFTIRVQSSLPPLISLEMVTRHICKFGLLNQLSRILGSISADPAHLIEPKLPSPFTNSADFLRLFPPAHSRPLISPRNFPFAHRYGANQTNSHSKTIKPDKTTPRTFNYLFDLSN